MPTQGAVLLWGAKSQARIVSAILAREGQTEQVLFDSSLSEPTFPTGSRFFTRPEDLRRVLSDCAEAVVCIGGRHGAQRAAIAGILRDRFGLAPRTVISAQAVVDPEATLEEGAQILMGACIGVAAQIGAFSIVNSNATVDHECHIGKGVHIMGGAAIAGRVTVSDFATIGTNATLLPDLRIAAGAQVGAGALVRHNVGQDEVVVGVPARRLRFEAPVVDLSVIDAV